MNRWTLGSGRWLFLDGKPVFALQRAEGVAPSDVDALAHRVCSLLNAAGTDLESPRIDAPRERRT